ncbi:homoserine O-acetyltransferase MetX [Prescottella agglutinans]|uniref:Homoserine O-acetyltransferase n=1 Tax=Prescottella agglutinans TaxID=1644129 RepID=A0ABT6M4S1_9NOCA|nr:homoserine O-acetyltransferase [Prescottella agglutinans]MDH6279297.1 homoserine O-acetyltransferase [Prescottella agglutinans]
MTVSSVRNARPAGFPPPDGQLGFVHIGSIELETGVVLPDVTLAVQRWGELSPNLDNVVLVEHALTGDSHVTGPADDEHPSPGWWDGMVGSGAPIDTDEWCVLAANVLGGCRGTTGPGSLAADGAPWGSRFPEISIRDQVTAEVALADLLGIERIAAVVGGSMGGMRALEWIVGHPDRVDAALILAAGARATADQIGTQTTQIQIVKSDPDWQGGDYHGTGRVPRNGLGLARRIAHLSYRTEAELDARFANDNQVGENPWAGGRYAVQSYLDHQADKLVARFDPSTYVLLTEALNRHDVGRGRGGVEAALAATNVPVIVGGVDSDRLYPLRLQQELADGLPGCDRLRVLESKDGHDGFLTEADAVTELLKETMELARAARRD